MTMYFSRNLLRDNRGVAAIEFALSITVLIITLLGVTEVTQLVRADMKLRHTTEAFAKMVSQQTAVTAGTITDLCSGAAKMMAPFSPQDFGGGVVSVTNVSGSMNTWSSTPCPAGGTADPVAATTLAKSFVANDGDSMLVVNGSYTYKPLFNFFIHASIPLTHTVLFRPRAQALIPFS